MRVSAGLLCAHVSVVVGMSLVEWLGGLSVWAYALIFVAALAETVPGVGVVVPGQLMVVAGGAAAGLGYLDAGAAVLVATFGAVLGDVSGYWAGRRGGRAFLLRFGARWGLRDHDLDRVGAALRRRPIMTIVLGRFNNLTRAFVPYAAGSVGFRRWRFLAINVVAGFAWALASVMLGVVFGRSYQAAELLVGRLLGMMLVLAVVFYLAYRALRWVHAGIRPSEAAWFVVATLALAGFLLVAEDVADHEGIVAYDAPVAAWARDVAATPAWGALHAISDLGAAAVVAPLVAATAIILWTVGQRRDAWAFGMVVAGTQALVWSLKQAFARARPVDAFEHASGYAFPSGHTTMAAVLAVAMVWLAYRHVRHRVWPDVAMAAAFAWVVLMAMSRLVLGVHYFSDVVGGALLGVAIGGFGFSGPVILPLLRERAAAWSEDQPGQ